MIGKFFVYFAFASTLLATIMYFLSTRKEGHFIKVGRNAYYSLIASIVIIAVLHLSNILSHNFQITYVWQYSSKELTDPLLLASFYAGQEGSFLLWALFVSLVGLFLMPYARKHNYESWVMGFYSLIMVFLTMMLIFKSPFDSIWESFPKEGLAKNFMPENGRGLNPILENYWMVIHPPILFIGYSMMSVPFVFALAGLIKKEYQDWIKVSLPWTLLGTSILGLGIMLGGFWAYETLGWGGFWGWDPVENSSLLPWLIAVALIHTMLVQKKTGGLIKTNFLLAMFSFLFVLYATFLTRSGILGDTSVHSFVDPGQLVYALLVIFQAVFVAIAIAVLAFRLRDISKIKMEFSAASREFVLSLGSILILCIALVVFIGTSWPIFTELLGIKKSSIDISYYNIWNLPIIILILILNAFSLYFSWKATSFSIFKKDLIISLSISIVLTIISVIAGLSGIGLIILAFSSYFAFVVNIQLAVRRLVKKPRSAGAYISHVGLSLLLLGVLTSGPLSVTEHISLNKGETKKALGYDFKWLDKVQIQKELQDREKFEYRIQVSKDGSSSIVKPIVYWSNFNNRESPFLEPSIKSSFSGDVYVSPKTVEAMADIPFLSLMKGQSGKLPNDSTISIGLRSFDMSRMMNEHEGTNTFILGAVLDIAMPDKKYMDTIYMAMDMQSGGTVPLWDSLGNTGIELGFTEFVQNKDAMAMSQAVIVSKKIGEELPPPIERISLEISSKPFIWLVWIGVIALVIGFLVSMIKYRQKPVELPIENYIAE
jgi:cytochrome c-type biogenesis protein CcmF